MTVGSIVQDERNERNERYRLTALLGSGATGSVFQGEAVLAGRESIAVKVPHARLSEEVRRRFWQEIDTLTKLRRVAGKRYFPDAWPGEMVESRQPVLCMELVRGERLTTLAARNNHHLDEGIALRAGLQYAKMLVAMHEVKLSCPDRKPHDVYWDAGRAELTVLDWNVVADGAEFKPKNDIYIFGRLWYELLTGSLPSPIRERLQRPLADHPYWSQISVGLQQILQRTLAPSEDDRFASAEALQKQLERHQRTMLDTDPADLSAAARRVLEDVRARQQALRSTPNYELRQYEELLPQVEEALRLCDAAARRSALDGEKLWQQALDVQKQIADPARYVRESIRQRKYEGVVDNLEGMKSWSQADVADQLKLRRWQAVAKAAQDGLRNNLYLSNYLPDIEQMLNALEKSDLLAAANTWETLAAKLDGAGWGKELAEGKELAARKQLDLLGSEAQFRNLYRAAHAAGAHSDYEQAIVRLEAAQRELAAFDDAAAEGYLSVLLRHIGATRDTLQQGLETLRDKQISSNGAGSILDEVKRRWEQKLYADAITDLQRKLDPLHGILLEPEQSRLLRLAERQAELLMQFDRAVEAQDWVYALAKPHGLLARGLTLLAEEGDHADYERSLRVITERMLRNAIEYIAPFFDDGFATTTEARWQRVSTPDEAGESLTTLQLLGDWYDLQGRTWRMEPIGNMDMGTNRNQLVQMLTAIGALERRDAQITELRRRYFEALRDGNSDKQRQVLDEAKQKGIEPLATLSVSQLEELTNISKLTSPLGDLTNLDKLVDAAKSSSTVLHDLHEDVKAAQGDKATLDSLLTTLQEIGDAFTDNGMRVRHFEGERTLISPREISAAIQEKSRELEQIQLELAAQIESAQAERAAADALVALAQLHFMSPQDYDQQAEKKISAARTQLSSIPLGSKLYEQLLAECQKSDSEYDSWRKLKSDYNPSRQIMAQMTSANASVRFSLMDRLEKLYHRLYANSDGDQAGASEQNESDYLLLDDVADFCYDANLNPQPKLFARLLTRAASSRTDPTFFAASDQKSFEIVVAKWWSDWHEVGLTSEWSAQKPKLEELQRSVRSETKKTDGKARKHSLFQEVLITWQRRVDAALEMGAFIQDAFKQYGELGHNKKTQGYTEKIDALSDRAYSFLETTFPMEVFALFHRQYQTLLDALPLEDRSYREVVKAKADAGASVIALFYQPTPNARSQGASLRSAHSNR